MPSVTGYESRSLTTLRHILIQERAKRAEAQRQVALIERELKRRRRAARSGK
jgi:hypothetical protein